MNNETVFRKKSMEAISSPEQLTDYIRVANPGMWMVLAAVAAFLIGVCVWGVFGRLDTTLGVVAVSDGNEIVCYVGEDEASAVKPDMTVQLDGGQNTQAQTYSILSVSPKPITVDDEFDDYTLHVGGLQRGEWVYVLKLDGSISQGVYSAKIVTESVVPMSFILN